MTLKECYSALGGDYEDAFGRLRSEGLLKKYVLKFLDDASFDTLCRAMAEGKTEEAFRAVHTLKGMCLTLGFARLAASSSQMTEALRGGDLEAGKALFDPVRSDYRCTADAIRAYQTSLGEI